MLQGRLTVYIRRGLTGCAEACSIVAVCPSAVLTNCEECQLVNCANCGRFFCLSCIVDFGSGDLRDCGVVGPMSFGVGDLTNFGIGWRVGSSDQLDIECNGFGDLGNLALNDLIGCGRRWR